MVFHRVFRQHSYSISTANRKKTLFIFIHLQLLMQIVHFFWYPDMPLVGWSSYSTFWAFLAFPSIDSLAASLMLSAAFAFTVIGLVVFAVLSFLVSAFLIKSNKEMPSVLQFLQKFCIELVCNLYFIPCSSSLLTLVKYSSSNYPYLAEYSTSISGNVLNYGIPGVVLGAVVLALLVALSFVYESCSYDMSYSLENNFYSQAHPYVNIYVKLFLLTQCVMMINQQSMDYVAFLKGEVFLYLFTSMIILYFVPYHCLFTNVVKFWVFSDATVVSTAFLLGSLNNSSTLIFIITIILQPFIIYLSYEIVKYRMSQFKSLVTVLETSFSNFEHSARSHLMMEDNHGIILQELNKHAHFSHDQLFKILCANYCYEALKNSNLAQIKIETVKTYSLNLPVTYNIHKCKDTLLKINIASSKALKRLNFSQNLDALMKTDLEVCSSLMMMYNKILEPNQKLSELKSLVLRSSSVVETVTKLYEALIEQSPASKFVLELYGLFLIDLLNNNEQGLSYLEKEKRVAQREKLEKQAKSTKTEECIFIISGNHGDQGKFLYASTKALEFLKIEKLGLSSTYIFEFLPAPFQRLHQKHLVNFADKCLTNTIPCNVFPFLLINRYLVECTSTTECIVYLQKTYFVTFLEPLGYFGKEVVLIDIDGIIISHSKGLSTIFELNTSHIEGKDINDYLPIRISDLTPGVPIKLELILECSLKEKHVAVFLESNVCCGTYSIIYITIEGNELDQWFTQEIREQSENIEIVDTLSVKKVKFSNFTHKVDEIVDPNAIGPQTINESYLHNSENTQEDKALEVSIKSLKVVRILVIASVRNIQKLTLITTIVAIGIFLYKMSQNLSDLNATQNLGEIYYTLLALAIVVRALDLQSIAKITTTISLTSGYTNLASLENYYSLLSNSTENWQNCPASDITWNSVLPNWRILNGVPTLYFSNLQDYIGETIRAVRFI